MTGVLLAIETSQRAGSVAIRRADGSVDHEPLRSAARHEDDLMPAIDRMFQRNSLSPRDLEAVGVSVGPGGFTGLRIAVSTAKMLAESLGAKIAAVPSALVAAESCNHAGPLLVCLASKRDTTWVTRLVRDDASHWQITGTPGIVSAAQIDVAAAEHVLADEYLPEAIAQRVQTEGVSTSPPVFDARACLAVAARMIAAGELTDSLAVAPIYARPPEAVRLWEQRGKAKPAG